MKHMPAPIAVTWKQYQGERQSFTKLHRLIDTYEALLKYSTVLAVQNFYAVRAAEKFPDVDERIRDRITLPSLGDWANFLREVLSCFAEREDDLFCRDLFLFRFRHFGRNPSPQRSFTAHGASDRLLALRNNLAHGATLPDDPRGPSALLAGQDSQGRWIHVVCGNFEQEYLLVITVYLPQSPKWKDPFTRGR